MKSLSCYQPSVDAGHLFRSRQGFLLAEMGADDLPYGILMDIPDSHLRGMTAIAFRRR